MFLLYSFVFITTLRVTAPESMNLYFRYMGAASMALYLRIGFVGTAISLWFNRVMYASMNKQIDADHPDHILLMDDEEQKEIILEGGG